MKNMYSFFLFLGIIDYNFVILRKGIHKLFELKDKEKESTEPRKPPTFKQLTN